LRPVYRKPSSREGIIAFTREKYADSRRRNDEDAKWIRPRRSDRSRGSELDSRLHAIDRGFFCFSASAIRAHRRDSLLWSRYARTRHAEAELRINNSRVRHFGVAISIVCTGYAGRRCPKTRWRRDGRSPSLSLSRSLRSDTRDENRDYTRASGLARG